MSKKSTLKILGNVQTVLEGLVTDDLMIPASGKLRFALGGSSFNGPKGIGETIVLAGQPHISWVDKGNLRTESNDDFRSSFLMGIDSDKEASSFSHYRPPAPVSLQTLYTQLAEKYPEGAAILGRALISDLYATYLKTPPIYHENINEKRKQLPPKGGSFIVR